MATERFMKISQISGPRRSEMVEADDPVPGARQVLVRVVASGVCTSDLSVWRTGGAGRQSSAEPIRLGHEIVGQVVAAGRDARGWADGDLVTGLGGQGFASLAVLDADRILPVPDRIEPALAVGEPVADLAEALSRTHMRAGDRVAVVGLGFMGLGLVQLVRDRAPGLLIGVDPVPAARRRALDLGADLAFAPGEVPAEYSTGEAGRAGDHRADLVLEATGATPGLKTAGALVRPFGTLCVVGYHHKGDAMMDMDLWYRGVTIVNGFCPDQRRLMRAMSDALDLIARHRFSYASLVTHRFGLTEVDQAFELMDARADGFVKAVLEP
jgi:threonine dehydrogenase-like Zn-dependent dehydrogenase